MSWRGTFPPAIERFLWFAGSRCDMSFAAVARMAADQFGSRAPSVDEVATFICHAYAGRRNLNRFRRDLDLTKWLLENSATGTINEIRARCIRRFGLIRTPSAKAIAAFLARSGYRWWRADPAAAGPSEMDLWIRQTASHMTLKVLASACADRFGRECAPSRSALHRRLQRDGLSSAGWRPALADDKEAVALLQTACTGTVTLDELHRALVDQIGADRARSRSTIHRCLTSAVNRPAKRKGHKFSEDIAAWLIQRCGSQTVDQLRAGCVAAYGINRAPSRSAIGRFVRKARL
jgi:hypothetical protein